MRAKHATGIIASDQEFIRKILLSTATLPSAVCDWRVCGVCAAGRGGRAANTPLTRVFKLQRARLPHIRGARRRRRRRCRCRPTAPPPHLSPPSQCTESPGAMNGGERREAGGAEGAGSRQPSVRWRRHGWRRGLRCRRRRGRWVTWRRVARSAPWLAGAAGGEGGDGEAAAEVTPVEAMMAAEWGQEAAQGAVRTGG